MRVLLSALILALLSVPALADQHSDDETMGRQVYGDLRAKNQIVDDSPYARVLQHVGARISAAAQPHWFAEKFYVIRGNQLNAFAAPGGYVFVNEGLLREVDDVDELANVLGHETAHLVLGHVSARVRQEQRKDVIFKLSHMLVKQGSQTSQNTYDIATGAANYTFLNFTRQQEYAADREGAWLAARAGYNPWGSVWFFREAERLQGDSGFEQYVQQHPSTNDRITALETYFKKNPQAFGRYSSKMPPGTGL
jgi:predicted Zn-dependent protease